MSVTEIGDKINVGAVFVKNRIVPKWFQWKNRKIDVKDVTYTWNTLEGNALLVHFSAVGEGGYYELSFNQKTLDWVLEKVESEG